MEGTAELFGTHRFDEQTGQLTLRIMPRSREEVPMLGRIKLIRDAVADGKPLSIDAVMKLDNREQLGTEAYAWCWALSKFLDTHPRYRDRYRALYKNVLNPKFYELFRSDFDKDWSDLSAEWPAYVATLDHGFDFDRMAMEFSSHGLVRDGAGGSHVIGIAADRGWQSSGKRLEAGKTYRVSAKGQFQIAAEQVDGQTKLWPCEPGGVTIEYHDGHPLGILLGAIRPDGEAVTSREGSLAQPLAIGLEATLKPTTSGTLYLRVNDSPAHLDDNRGTLAVTVEP
jgi:hypothetical protein